MQKSTAALCVVWMIAVFAINAPSQSGWNKFSPEGGNFSVLMPGKPKLEVENKVGRFGPYTSYLFSETNGGTIYMVGWTDYDPSLRLNVQGELNTTRDNFIRSVNGALATEIEINHDGHSGIEFTATMMDAKFYVISRVYVVGNRPYQIAAVTKAKFDRTDVNRFLWSFKFDPIQ
jgi:hypothetical protein